MCIWNFCGLSHVGDEIFCHGVQVAFNLDLQRDLIDGVDHSLIALLKPDDDGLFYFAGIAITFLSFTTIRTFSNPGSTTVCAV
jgi:hypothetical protein